MRQVWKPSVTVAAIIAHEGRYLLVEEHTADGLRLNNPAGHLEPGESPLDGAVREAPEETACVFTPEAMLGVYMARTRRGDDDVTYLRLAFSGRVGAPIAGRALDSGIVRRVWMTPDEVRASRERHRSALVWQCVADHLAGRRMPLDAVFVDPSVQALQDAAGAPR